MHLKAITLRCGKEVKMRKETAPSKKKEPTVEAQDELVQEKESISIMQKCVPPLVKEYIPRLLYPSRLKKDQTNE